MQTKHQNSGKIFNQYLRIARYTQTGFAWADTDYALSNLSGRAFGVSLYIIALRYFSLIFHS